MEINKGKCRKCGNLNYILPSNNPLVESMCPSCVNKALDVSKLEHFAFFCRTFNLPFYPNTYLSLYKEHKGQTWYKYIEALIDNGKLEYTDKVTDVWKDVEAEWSKVKTYTDIVLKVNAVKESFLDRSRVKWGPEYSFAELIQLENLLTNTIKAYNITDPMRLDAIKKACKLSVKIDAMIESGDSKSIKDYTAAYQSFLKAAQIDDMGQVATEGTIKTVADLYKYMEKNGFEFKFYDKAERDIVDKTITDIKQSIRREVENATGLDFKLEDIKKNLLNKIEDDITNEVLDTTPLRDLVNMDYYEEVEMEADKELAEQDVDFEYLED